MRVAVSRGAEFTRFQPDHRESIDMGPLIGPGLDNDKVALQALHDVAEWLGFGTGADYIRTMDSEKKKIFERRTY